VLDYRQKERLKMPSYDMETRYGLDNIDPQDYEKEENMKVTAKNTNIMGDIESLKKDIETDGEMI
jgi:hypothetical protein